MLTSDHAFRETLSPMAAEACAIVSQIRFEEQQTVWTKEYEDTLAAEVGDVYPGMMFNLARDRMEKTKLWKIIQRMPKGALLHCHLEAMVDLKWLIDEMFNIGGFHIIADGPLHTPSTLETSGVRFKWLSSPREATSIWSESYTSGQMIPVEAAADEFPGGRPAFKVWLQSRAMVTTEESLKHHHGPNAIWRKFQSCFDILGTLLHYEPLWRGFIGRMLKALIDDGVQYVDIRAAFTLPFYRTGSEVADEDNVMLIQILDEEIKAFKSSKEGAGFWDARLIWTSIRSFNTKTIVQSMSSILSYSIDMA